jgi:hypothetical protein
MCGTGPTCGANTNCIGGSCYDAGIGPCGVCDGCCVGNTMCIPFSTSGTSNSMCGRSGASCQNCGGNGPCVNGFCSG